MPYILPSKLHGYLGRLRNLYERQGKRKESDLISACSFSVEEGVDHDNWDGGTDGHAVDLYLPLDLMDGVDLDQQDAIQKAICQDLNKCADAIRGEWFQSVRFHFAHESDPDFRRATPFNSAIAIRPETLSFWKSNLLRLFVSHRDAHKADVNELALELEEYGITSFVAHETISPTKEWRREIISGLTTMEAMLVFLTDDFEQSSFTNQEVGFALAKNVPIVSLKLGSKAPPGFISDKQAARGRIGAQKHNAGLIAPLVWETLRKQDRFNDALVSRFVAAPSFTDAKDRFDKLRSAVETLTEAHVAIIVDGFQRNDQLHQSVYLTNNYERLRRYLEQATGRSFEIKGRQITELKRRIGIPNSELDDDIPF
ncbi:toll/interleukin-1 receptor domain-containing protein [Chelatococcus sp.]|uniref:toll/interleukin-1 receptor domain-containing protein n=1 Tax=Chelatococcus sp. TaxID=1953771 RepID=UPI001EBB7DCB|nr:toll/interleukin-1 receptor domain-containing protein [Chelatococcus sp.]MBX3545580.1 toll/interleukin-1 receptor domain-containing protein [Chelatococcus sp.]